VPGARQRHPGQGAPLPRAHPAACYGCLGVGFASIRRMSRRGPHRRGRRGAAHRSNRRDGRLPGVEAGPTLQGTDGERAEPRPPLRRTSMPGVRHGRRAGLAAPDPPPGSHPALHPTHPLASWLAGQLSARDESYQEGRVSGAGTQVRRMQVRRDAGPSDAGPPNAGPPNAGPPNAGPPNAGPPNAGPSDAGPSDAGPSDAGPSDAGPSDAGVGTAPGDGARRRPEGRQGTAKGARERRDGPGNGPGDGGTGQRWAAAGGR